MKIRKKFVSNSSSSSFILCFDKKPESALELKEILFKEEDYFYDPFYEPDASYLSDRTEKYTTLEVAETIFKDIKNQKPLTKTALREEISNGTPYVDDVPVTSPCMEDFKDKNGKVAWEAYDRAWVSYYTQIGNHVWDLKGDKKSFVVEYSDNESQYESALEHGDTFENIEHYIISKH